LESTADPAAVGPTTELAAALAGSEDAANATAPTMRRERNRRRTARDAAAEKPAGAQERNIESDQLS
jgi:hypothetical protein